jgi:large subunit ribosomal protein L4
MQLAVYNLDGKETGQLAAADQLFGAKPNLAVVQSTLTWFLAANRRGTHSAKTRAEVAGGGIKPWRQKGTGRARVGSIRSPLWRKGGVIFGPKPRDYNFTLPKKVRRLALRVALSDKARDGKLKIVEKLQLPEAKTRAGAKMLKALGLSGKVLIVTAELPNEFDRAVRNLKGVTLAGARSVNIFELLNADWVLADQAAVKIWEGALV